MAIPQSLVLWAKRCWAAWWVAATVALTLPVGAQEQRVFNIPVQPLSDALTAFGRQSGLQITYQPELVTGLFSQAVSGSSTPEQALQQLLSGTGLEYRFTAANTVTLERMSAVRKQQWLRPVVVTAKRLGEAEDPERFDRIDPISRLTREQFEEMPNDRRLSDVMDRMPGVFFRGPVGVNRDIKFRGLDKGFNRFELDGIQLPGLSGARDFRVNRLSPLSVDVIEILRNPGAAYESDGIAGRIAVKSRPIPDEWTLDLEGHTGGIDTLDGSSHQLRAAVGGRPSDRFGYTLFIDQARTPREKDKIKTTFDENRVFKEKEREDELVVDNSLNLSGELALIVASNTFRLKPRFDLQYSKKDKTKEKRKPEKNPEQELEDGTSEEKTAGATLEHERRFGAGVQLKSDLSYFTTLEDSAKTKRVLKAGALDKTEKEKTDLDDQFWQIRSSLKMPIDIVLPQDFHIGVQARSRRRDQEKTKLEIKPDDTRADKTEPGDSFVVKERLLAAFIEDEFFFSERLSIKPGVRVETLRRESGVSGSSDATSTRTDVNPSLQLRYGLTGATVFKAAVSRKVNRPKLEEVVPFSKEKGNRFEVGNPSVQPAHAWNFDAELTYGTKDLLLSALAFRKEIRNVIGLTKTGEEKNDKSVFRIENIGDGWVHGLELEQRVNMQMVADRLEGLVLWANQGIYDSELKRNDTGETQPFDEQRNFLLNAGLDYRFPDRRTLLTIAGKYLGSLEKVKAGDEREVEKPRLLVDVGLRYTVTPNISLTFDALNILNLDQDKTLFKGRDRTFDSETPGRVFFVGLKAKF